MWIVWFLVDRWRGGGLIDYLRMTPPWADVPYLLFWGVEITVGKMYNTGGEFPVYPKDDVVGVAYAEQGC